MSATHGTMENLFAGGPPLKIEQRLGLVTPSDPCIARRAAIVFLGWVPLLVLTVVEDVLLHKRASRSFLLDFGVHARFLLAAPILVLAEAWCHPALGRITSYFVKSGIVGGKDRERFDAIIQSTMRLLNSTLAEVLTFISAYALAVGVRIAWQIPLRALSAPEFWQTWVSLPLLFVLFFGWLWRQFLWCRFLWRNWTARLEAGCRSSGWGGRP